MQVPLEIAFKGLDKSDAIEDLVREKLAKVEKLVPDAISCRVVVEQPQKIGNPYGVTIVMRVPPEHEFAVKKESSEGDFHAALPKLLRDAFEALRRQLTEFKEKRRGEVKKHPEQQVQAVVSRIFKDRGYGFLQTIDGRDIYFHENAVLHNDFARLEIGTGVSFQEQSGEEGPQASSVEIVDKPGVRASKVDES